MCITETGKVFVRLNDDTIREFTEAAAEYARQILGEVISLRDQVSDIISSASSISDEAVEQILDATSQVAAMKRDLDEQEVRMTGIADRCQEMQTATESAATSATQSQQSASDSAELAEKWANYMEDTVDGNEYSAKYYATSITGDKDYVDQKAVEVGDYAMSAQQAADTAQAVTDLYNITEPDIDTIVDGGE